MRLSYTVRPVSHDKNARAKRTVPPRNGPHGRTTNRYGTHLTLSSSGRAWTFLWHSRSPAAHRLRYGATFFPNLTWRALNEAIHITVQSSNKQKSLRAYCARNDCSTHAHALQEVAKMQPFVTQRDTCGK